MSQLSVFACPLCGEECESRNSVRVHLHVSHRKSLLIDEYLAAVGQ